MTIFRIATGPLSQWFALRGLAAAALACGVFSCPTHIAAQTKETPSCVTTTAQDGGISTNNTTFPGGPTNVGVDVLSDTRGVDFAPYRKQILPSIRKTWVPLIPEEGRPPQNMPAETLIRFSIASSGKLLTMHLDASTHEQKFDRAAWGAITGVGQFPPLPSAFTGRAWNFVSISS